MGINYALELPEEDVFPWVIALGKARGGDWDYEKMEWIDKTPPKK